MEATTPLSDSSDIDANEVTAHDEAGHAVMAHLFDCPVYSIRYTLNVKGTYNGETIKSFNESQRRRDPNVPYDELRKLGLQKEKEAALINVAGKAAQRIWYRQRGFDEALADFGLGGGQDNDEKLLEEAILEGHRPEELEKIKQDTEESAIRILETKRCWEVVEAVAQASLEKIKQGELIIPFKDVQKLMEDTFARQN